jgi:hypothetical protein
VLLLHKFQVGIFEHRTSEKLRFPEINSEVIFQPWLREAGVCQIGCRCGWEYAEEAALLRHKFQRLISRAGCASPGNQLSYKKTAPKGGWMGAEIIVLIYSRFIG